MKLGQGEPIQVHWNGENILLLLLFKNPAITSLKMKWSLWDQMLSSLIGVDLHFRRFYSSFSITLVTLLMIDPASRVSGQRWFLLISWFRAAYNDEFSQLFLLFIKGLLELHIFPCWWKWNSANPSLPIERLRQSWFDPQS